MSKNRQIIGLLVLFAVIILPSGIDDAFTTVPLIAWLGADGYLKLVLALLGALLIWDVKLEDIRKEVKKWI